MWLRDDAAAAINALEDKHGVIRINSAGRTVAEQNDLIRRFDAGEPGIFIPMRPAEESTHVKDGGIAVDVFNYTDDRAKLEEFGFEWFGTRDKVHYTFKGWSPAPVLSRDEATAQRQNHLNLARGEKLDVDGIPGPKTVAAIKRYQTYLGVAADGVWGPATQAAHDREWARVNAPKHARDSFAEYQAALNKFGYGLVVDNVWGRKSSNALADFQRKHGLTPDRIVGPKTRAALGI
jgi:hypothetical protein